MNNKLHWIFRLFYFQYKRVTNKYYQIINLVKLKLFGVKYGKRCIIHGHFIIALAKGAKMIIGDNFCSLNGRGLNPLSSNICCSIRVNKNAELIIGNNVGMSSAVIWSHKSITIGNNVNIGANSIIMDSDAHSINYLQRRNITLDQNNKMDKPIIIGDDVLIGVNSIILKGVTIGKRSIIGAGSVVTKSIPEACIAAGNPCRVIKNIGGGN